LVEEIGFDDIKKSVIIAIFEIDELLNIVVLKGGNAIDLIYMVSARSSLDVDFSLEKDFPGDIGKIREAISNSLSRIFGERGYVVFDFDLYPRPEISEQEKDDFWGGYRAEFKIISKEDYNKLDQDLNSVRRNAIVVAPGQRRKFYIEFSKYEFCKQKVRKELDNYYIFVYTPEMLVVEKIRSICQQMEEYEQRKHAPTARARDFIDIYVLCEHFNIDLTLEHNISLLQDVFKAKRVPLALIGNIEKYREFHRSDFASVNDTIKPSFHIETFDFYFDYLLEKISTLKSLRDK